MNTFRRRKETAVAYMKALLERLPVETAVQRDVPLSEWLANRLNKDSKQALEYFAIQHT